MQQLIIEDGFYSDPEQMKTLFGGLDYTKNENIIQGQICPMPYANDDMLNYMQSIIGVPQGENLFEFVEGSGTFIINTENDPPARPVCVQFPDKATQWVGIVSLNKTEEPHFLKFYRNKRTGWDGVPNDPEEFAKEKIYSFEHFENFLELENHDWEDKWVETSRVELKFNQLILFRPGLFHSYSDVFGDTKETGRLLQFFFLKPRISE